MTKNVLKKVKKPSNLNILHVIMKYIKDNFGYFFINNMKTDGLMPMGTLYID